MTHPRVSAQCARSWCLRPVFWGELEKRGVLAVDGVRGGVVRSEDGVRRLRATTVHARAHDPAGRRRSPRNQRPVRLRHRAEARGSGVAEPFRIGLTRVHALELDRVFSLRVRAERGGQGTRGHRVSREHEAPRRVAIDAVRDSRLLVRVHGGGDGGERSAHASLARCDARTREDAEPRGFIDDDDVIVDVDEHVARARATSALVGFGSLRRERTVDASSRTSPRRPSSRGTQSHAPGGGSRERRGGDESRRGAIARRSPRDRPRDAARRDARRGRDARGGVCRGRPVPGGRRSIRGGTCGANGAPWAGPPRAKKGREEWRRTKVRPVFANPAVAVSRARLDALVADVGHAPKRAADARHHDALRDAATARARADRGHRVRATTRPHRQRPSHLTRAPRVCGAPSREGRASHPRRSSDATSLARGERLRDDSFHDRC